MGQLCLQGGGDSGLKTNVKTLQEIISLSGDLSGS